MSVHNNMLYAYCDKKVHGDGGRGGVGRGGGETEKRRVYSSVHYPSIVVMFRHSRPPPAAGL